MKGLKIMTLALTLGFLSIFGINNASAKDIGWISSLDLSYNEIYNGSIRRFISGTNRINISVDGFNTSTGSVRYSGGTTMKLALGASNLGKILCYKTSYFNYGTCQDVIMGTYSAGWHYYTFFSKIYNDSTGNYDAYDGIKSSQVVMYPAPND